MNLKKKIKDVRYAVEPDPHAIDHIRFIEALLRTYVSLHFHWMAIEYCSTCKVIEGSPGSPVVLSLVGQEDFG